MIVRASVHGAVSLVNAIATGKGATLGIGLGVWAEVEMTPGRGIIIESDNASLSSRLVHKTVGRMVPRRDLERNKFRISLKSEIPTGYGLKSSSAISSSVALACARLFGDTVSDSQVLLAGVRASIDAKVSITGAYDDACACYYGGFAVTDNYKNRLVRTERGPNNLLAVIFIPKSRKRGNVRKLRSLAPVFANAWNLAKNSDYWNAMVLNGLATSSALNSDPGIILDLIEKGAMGASVSGNGPAIAAITKKENLPGVKKVFSALDGRTTVSKINNKRAEAHEL